MILQDNTALCKKGIYIYEEAINSSFKDTGTRITGKYEPDVHESFNGLENNLKRHLGI